MKLISSCHTLCMSAYCAILISTSCIVGIITRWYVLSLSFSSRKSKAAMSSSSQRLVSRGNKDGQCNLIFYASMDALCGKEIYKLVPNVHVMSHRSEVYSTFQSRKSLLQILEPSETFSLCLHFYSTLDQLIAASIVTITFVKVGWSYFPHPHLLKK